LKLLIALILIAAALKVSDLIVHDQSANPRIPDHRRALHHQTIITSDHARLQWSSPEIWRNRALATSAVDSPLPVPREIGSISTFGEE
jgi:hypothetical protein